MAVQDGEIVRASARQQFALGQDLVNVWYFEAEFTADQTDQDTIDKVLEALDIIYSQLNGITTNTLVQVDVKIDVVMWLGGEIHTVRTLGTHSWAGTWYSPTGAGNVLPPGAAALVKSRTWDGKVYSRKFFGGMAEAISNDGVFDSTAMTALGLAAAEILVPRIISAGNTLYACLMSSKYSLPMQFAESVGSAVVAYQRRRRQGTGS